MHHLFVSGRLARLKVSQPISIIWL